MGTHHHAAFVTNGWSGARRGVTKWQSVPRGTAYGLTGLVPALGMSPTLGSEKTKTMSTQNDKNDKPSDAAPAAGDGQGASALPVIVTYRQLLDAGDALLRSAGKNPTKYRYILNRWTAHHGKSEDDLIGDELTDAHVFETAIEQFASTQRAPQAQLKRTLAIYRSIYLSTAPFPVLPAIDASAITYAHVVSFWGAHLPVVGQALTAVRRTHINKWLAYHRLTLESVVGDEFKDRFPERLEEYLHHRQQYFAAERGVNNHGEASVLRGLQCSFTALAGALMAIAVTRDGEALSYAALIAHHRATMIEESLPPKQRSSALGHIRQWLAFLQKTDDAVIGTEFAGHIVKGKVAQFMDWLRAQDYAKQTCSNAAASVRGLHASYHRMLYTHCLKDLGFKEALRELFKQSGISPGKAHKLAGIRPPVIYDWLRGTTTPAAGSTDALRRLEKVLGAPAGFLVGKLPMRRLGAGTPATAYQRFWGKGELREARHQALPYNATFAVVQRKPYAIALPEPVQRAWEEWCAFKSKDRYVRPDGTMIAGIRTWKEGTRNRNLRSLSRFFGFLVLDRAAEDPHLRGLGHQPDALRFTMVCNPYLVEQYIDFRRGRNWNGAYNGDHLAIISLGLTLLDPQTGFLRLHPRYGADLTPPVPAAEWPQWCDTAHKTLSALYRSTAKLARPTREPSFPIRDILDQQRPRTVIDQMIERMKADLPPETNFIWRAAAFRDLVLLLLIAEDPLRIKHFRMMRFGVNLVQHDDGSWWLHWETEDFKNPDSHAKGRRFRLPEHTWWYITEYRDKYRPRLRGADQCDFVFCPKGLAGTKECEMMTHAALWRIVIQATAKYIPGCPGFGPHALRHILGTDFLKQNPGQYHVAGALLGSSPKTVERHYAHLTSSDFLARAQQYRAAMLALQAGALPEGVDALQQEVLRLAKENEELRARLDQEALE